MNRIDFDKLDKIFPNAYFDSAAGCSEPGYDDNPVILADWNHVSNKTFDSLENKGFSCEWMDEWIMCDECYKVFRSSPNSYDWQMFGVICDGYVLCGSCLSEDPIDYLESLENNPHSALTHMLLDVIDPSNYGYTLNQNGFENGWHPGQNDDPKKILEDMLENNPDNKYIFAMTGQGQFDVEFAIYKKDKENEN